jgi:hypothetical protein
MVVARTGVDDIGERARLSVFMVKTDSPGAVVRAGLRTLRHRSEHRHRVVVITDDIEDLRRREDALPVNLTHISVNNDSHGFSFSLCAPVRPV